MAKKIKVGRYASIFLIVIDTLVKLPKEHFTFKNLVKQATSKLFLQLLVTFEPFKGFG